ncbi:hypothetical protein PR202_ga21877 [Eleusine coracana subsp. coracana]|uniref:Myb/SANT-like domain-containing protein n=1 Tax=Eleusine coracana subsp. coracana TaxID=191504 RepID=A0AAV5D058_ELECO|nr:hypothetical protein PR202_ga21877 [Eleusine coracana subsp. coracana]
MPLRAGVVKAPPLEDHAGMTPPSSRLGRNKRAAASDAEVSICSRGHAKNAYKASRTAGSNMGSQEDESEATGEEDTECEGYAKDYMVQLKNKLDLLKGLYGFWQQLMKDTGLGWNDALGTVEASEDYWEKNTKGHPTWRQLKEGPLEHEKLLHKMFQGFVVDGSTALAPGQGIGDDDGILGGRANDDFVSVGDDGTEQMSPYASPAVSGSFTQRSLSHNHGGKSPSAVTSPMKTTKNPMVRVMKSIHATLEANCAIANRVMLGDHPDEKIAEVLYLIVECGASEESVEHFMATLLFKSAENRSTFKAPKTNKGRLAWLNRHCKKEGLV